MPANLRRSSLPLRLLPSGPDRVHDLSPRRHRHEPNTYNAVTVRMNKGGTLKINTSAQIQKTFVVQWSLNSICRPVLAMNSPRYQQTIYAIPQQASCVSNLGKTPIRMWPTASIYLQREPLVAAIAFLAHWLPHQWLLQYLHACAPMK